MRHVPTVVRVLVGLLFTITGLNGFFHFLPMPAPEGAMAAVMGGFAAAKYLFPLIFATQLAGGLILLSGRFVPLGLALLAPVIVNIFLLHLALTPVTPIAFFLLFAEIFLAWAYRDAFIAMLNATAKPRMTAPAV